MTAEKVNEYIDNNKSLGMRELALEYVKSIELIRTRIHELKAARELATTRDERFALDVRIEALEDIRRTTSNIERHIRMKYLGVQYWRRKRACYAQKK